jgi:hypothetical protein
MDTCSMRSVDPCELPQAASTDPIPLADSDRMLMTRSSLNPEFKTAICDIATETLDPVWVVPDPIPFPFTELTAIQEELSMTKAPIDTVPVA